MDHLPDPSLIGLTDLAGPPAAATEPLVLLHGWTGSKEDFDSITGALAQRRRIVVPDLPGHGETPPTGAVERYGLGVTARWVLQALDHLGVKGFHLLGHSLGGLLAQRVAHEAPHRVSALVLVGSGLGAVGEQTADRILAIARTAWEQGMAAAWRTAAPDDGAGDPRGAFVRERFLAMTPEAVLGGARALVTAAPLGAFLRGLDFPVLVCHGEGDDAWLPHEQRLLARTITGARYQVIPDALHSPAVENPAGLLAVLTPFLDAADASAPVSPTPAHR